MKRKWPTVTVVVLIFAMLLGYLVCYSVRVDQVAAHYRFGKVKRVIRPPLLAVQGEAAEPADPLLAGVPVERRAGWFFKLPIFDKVEKFDQRVRYVDGKLTQLQLPDENQIIPRVYATWRVVDPVGYQKTLEGDDETARAALKQIISGETPEIFGRYNLDDIVNTDSGKLKFDEIERQIHERVKASVESPEKGYGIRLCSLGISWIALPEDATRAVFARMEQERRTEADKLIEEGKKIKRTTEAQAKAKRDEILAVAEAQARSIRAEGEAEAARHYETFARQQRSAHHLRAEHQEPPVPHPGNRRA